MYRDKPKKKITDKHYYKTHREKCLAVSKAWRQANPKHVKTYREAHKKERALNDKKWAKANPEKCREKSHKREALKLKTQIESINEKIVFMRDGWKCQICHKRVNKKSKYPNPMRASLDHIVPLSRGGAHIYANVQLAHLKCNLNKRAGILPQGEQIRLF